VDKVEKVEKDRVLVVQKVQKQIVKGKAMMMNKEMAKGKEMTRVAMNKAMAKGKATMMMVKVVAINKQRLRLAIE